MSKFKVGDEVVVKAAAGANPVAGWLHNEKAGVVQATYEGQPFPNDVKFTNGGALCFSDEELVHAADQEPGRRLLNETKSLPMGIDTMDAHKVMKAALSSTQEVDLRRNAVESPSHYTNHPSGVECIEIVKHMNFPIGNAIKYLWRAGLKGDAIEDLQKARQYIDIEIDRRKETA
ncbi:DUF3310 domain-containing protein [Streptomyces sp. NPDC018045]|uniref:DUF3310 domain-containing protein n=1 Tax=Streptomyces sp. NPDC018045 TaxID=3365037 RepID=UPI00379FC326